MSDQTGLNSEQLIGITGINSSGAATTAVNSDVNGNMLVKDYADGTSGSAVPSVATQVAGSDGTNLRTFKVDSNGSNYNVLTGPNAATNGFYSSVDGFNNQRTVIPGSDLFNDKFDTGSLDTTNRWAAVNVGTGSNSVSVGQLMLVTGTTASNAATILTQPTFENRASAQANFSANIILESGTIITNTHRFWGQGSVGANTTANPLTDAIGFEIDTTGALNAVVYQGGTKIFTQTLTAITDGLPHRYSYSTRTDKTVFYIDSSDGPSASASQKTPNVQLLPIRIALINGSTPPGTAPTLKLGQTSLSDIGRNNTAISDGTFGWRKATISSNGDLQAKDIINSAGLHLNISVGTSAIEAKVGGSPLANRKSLTAFNNSSVIIYWGYSNLVTTSTGTPIFPYTPATWSIGPGLSVFFIAAAGANDVRITEGA